MRCFHWGEFILELELSALKETSQPRFEKQLGRKESFCVGMDLKQRLDIIHTNEAAHGYPHGGFAGMSSRTGKKPIVIACNGHAHGSTPK